MGQRIWVVDDEPFIRTAMLAVLEEVGYEARGFADAEGLYTALVQEGVSPDLLVLDQRLPDAFGTEIVHSLRQRPQDRDIPVVFVTAIDDEEADRLVELAPVLRKPFDFTEFVEIVRSNLPEPDDAPEAG
jgi:CheY-like chemotaxis protein